MSLLTQYVQANLTVTYYACQPQFYKVTELIRLGIIDQQQELVCKQARGDWQGDWRMGKAGSTDPHESN